MVLHHASRTAFVHIPKCGGTSVEQALCTAMPWALSLVHSYLHYKKSWFVIWTSWAYFLLGGAWRWFGAQVVAVLWWFTHDPYDCVPADSLLTHTPLIERLVRPGPYRRAWSTYRCFTIVRNPYTRLVSAYKQMQLHRLPFAAYSFEQFCLDAQRECATYLDARGSFAMDRRANVFLLPQYVFVCDREARLCLVPRVLKFESLEAEWAALRRDWRTECAYPPQLPHKNASSSRGKVTWTPALADIVFCTYQRDFEWFGYERESWREMS